MSERLAKAESLFHETLELPPGQCEAFLQKACAEDAELGREVAALIRASGIAGSWLKDTDCASVEPAVLSSLPDGISEGPGTVVDRYKLLEKIGEGGFGVVYMAEQEAPVRRKVALKIIKLGMDTKSVIARFEAERQALALMDHPNIAKVLDAGATEKGRPYFVMELVRGIPITSFCDENRLTTTARLELFIQVCSAIQHAHQKGVVHRDIKPTNVLVTLHDGAPYPMVIDFGVAKAINQRLTEKTLFTNFAQMIGTPAYMSPEQAEMSKLDVDTRSDVYSLGVLLYELLTGTTPFPEERLRESGYAGMQRIICEEEPQRPSTRITRQASIAQSQLPNRPSTIDNDLDWIVMKCLEKERGRRYETADSLGMDVRRHLDNEPILARPPSRLYEFRKTVRRHKFGFAAAAAVLVALSAGVLVSAWQVSRARAAEREAFGAVRDANQRLHESLLAQARASRLSGEPHRAREAIQAAAKLNPTSETRDEAVAALAMSGLGDIRSWCSLSLSYETPDFSDDLSLCAYVVQTTLIVSRTSDWKEIARFEIPGGLEMIDLTSDGNYVATSERLGQIRIFDTRKQSEIFKLSYPDEVDFKWIEFTPDGKMLAVLDAVPNVRIFAVPSGNLLQSLPVEPSGIVRFDPLGQRIAVASENEIQVLDRQTGDVSHRRKFPTGIRGMTWYPGGAGLAVGLASDEIHVWDFARERSRSIPTSSTAYTIAFSHDGDMMVSGTYPSQMWSVGSFRPLSSTLGGTITKFARNDSTLGFFRSNFGVGVWNVVRSRVCYIVPELSEKANSGPGLGFSIDGRYVGLATETEFQIWDWRDNRMVTTKPSLRAHSLIFLPSQPWILVIDSDGVHRYRLRYSADGSLEGMDDGEPLANIPQDRYYRSSITPNGNLLAVANPTTTLVYDLARQEIVRQIDSRRVLEVKLSPDGRHAVTSTYRGNGSRVWDIATGKEIKRISQEDGHTCFSPDGRWLAYGTSHRVDVWETSDWTRRVSKTFSSEEVTGLGTIEFSPNGRFLAVIDMHMPALLLNPETGDEIGRLTLPTPMRTYSATFSTNSSFLALAGPDGTRIWDLAALDQELLALGLAWGKPTSVRSNANR